jgi:endo-1,4-beta-xylanase
MSAFAIVSTAELLSSASNRCLKTIFAAENSLRDLAAEKGLLYGCATSPDHLSADPEFARLVTDQCNLLVPENALNWKYTEPRQGEFDFHMGDWMSRFAKEHNMKFGGGTVVWHEGLPSWFSNLPQDAAQKAMTNHVTQTISHFRGQAFYWVVVNEALAFRGAGANMRDTPFLRVIGPNYIEASFRAAAAADPNAILVYNDSHLEYDIPEDEYRRSTLLKLLKGYLADKVPIGALGLQSHLRTGSVPFNSGKLRDFLSRVADMGLKIVVSEMDVSEKGPESALADRDQAIANEISRYLEVVLQQKSVIAVVTWGLTSRYSWLSNYAPRSDGQQVRQLPYDSDLHPTRAWQALAAAFEHAPHR